MYVFALSHAWRHLYQLGTVIRNAQLMYATSPRELQSTLWLSFRRGDLFSLPPSTMLGVGKFPWHPLLQGKFIFHLSLHCGCRFWGGGGSSSVEEDLWWHPQLRSRFQTLFPALFAPSSPLQGQSLRLSVFCGCLQGESQFNALLRALVSCFHFLFDF